MSNKLDIGVKVMGTPVEAFKFPAGEIQVRIPDTVIGFLEQDTTIDVYFTLSKADSDSIIGLALALDAVERIRAFNNNTAYNLAMPYVPYGRQDRACDVGEAFSLKVFGNLINSLGFDSVATIDPHSAVTGAVIDNLLEVGQAIHAGWIAPHINTNIVLIAPDAGATKKVNAFAKELIDHGKAVEVVQANKVRDVTTGKITNTELVIPIGLRDVNNVFLVVDDICDGGGTFLPIADKIADQVGSGADIRLFVSHGIFSKGLDNLGAMFNVIYCINNMSQYEQSDNFVVFGY